MATGPATGWYVQISARGVITGGGFYDADAETVYLIRPDTHIAGRWKSANPADVLNAYQAVTYQKGNVQ